MQNSKNNTTTKEIRNNAVSINTLKTCKFECGKSFLTEIFPSNLTAICFKMGFVKVFDLPILIILMPDLI